MAITYGFFNSLNNDRVYDADDISSMFDGIILSGVYSNIGDAFQVVADSGMDIIVKTGRAMVDTKWIKNDAPSTITLTSADVALPRYTGIFLRKDVLNRNVSIVAVDGTPASTPTKPSCVRNAEYYDLCLAYILVGANVNDIVQSNIEDTRANTDLCGFVTSPVSINDTNGLFLQYAAAYAEALGKLQSWESEMQARYDAWYQSLTEDLVLNQQMRKFEVSFACQYSTTKLWSSLYPSGYSYEDTDVILVYINGLLGIYGDNYTFTNNELSIIFDEHDILEDNVVTVVIFKPANGGSGSGGGTSNWRLLGSAQSTSAVNGGDLSPYNEVMVVVQNGDSIVSGVFPRSLVYDTGATFKELTLGGTVKGASIAGQMATVRFYQNGNVNLFYNYQNSDVSNTGNCVTYLYAR